MEFLFAVFPLLFLGVFGLVFYTIISGLARDAKREKKNDASPRLTVQATVVAKREEMLRHRHNSTNGMSHSHYSTNYYATFQFESGDRLELPVEGFEYGMLVEGDKGRLSFQGTRFLGFERG